MSGETENQVSGWSVDTLKELLETRIDGVQKEIKVAFEASEKAINKAETATEKRFEGVNEFRGQLQDQAGKFIARDLADSKFEDINKSIVTHAETNAAAIRALASRMDRAQGIGEGVKENRSTTASSIDSQTKVWGAVGLAIIILFTGINTYENSHNNPTVTCSTSNSVTTCK